MEKITVLVSNVRKLCDEVFEYTFVSKSNNELPSYSPGSHIDVFVSDTIVRQYSLIGSGDTTDHYRIAVQREQNGRGGSVSLIERFRVGSLVKISEPRNNFKLVDSDESILLAGGIGITPLIGMAEYLFKKQKKFSLNYFCRTKSRKIAIQEVCPSLDPKLFKVHCDDDPLVERNPLEKILANPQKNTHIYFCGPTGFMNKVIDLTSQWPKENLHKESFAAKATEDQKDLQAFDVTLSKSGRVITVNASESILDAFKRSGVEVSSSCESGLCGSCKVRYTQGEPIHNDLVLTDDERRTHMLICVSRPSSNNLVLEI